MELESKSCKKYINCIKIYYIQRESQMALFVVFKKMC